MQTTRSAAICTLATLLTCLPAAHAVDTHDTRLLEQPDIGGQHVAFVYENDVWIADRSGGPARRLTTAVGAESAPHFSPDGSWIAFSGNYDGNVDVYLMRVDGGAPVRLTWHGGPDIVQGFLPDGRVLFSSYRNLHTDRMQQLFAVSPEGGPPQQLPVPDGDDAQVSADGRRIAYSTMPPLYKQAIPQAKNYRGGDASRIWIMDLDDYAVQAIPQPASRCNDLNPVWSNGRLYFSSDRNGEFNLFSFDPRTGGIEQLTRYDDFPILNLNEGDGRLIYEHAGSLHVFETSTDSDRPLTIAAAADLRETRPRIVSDPGYVRSVTASPDLASVAIEYRGEIVTLHAQGATVRNLSQSSGANDRSPAWSADGAQLAWFSDQSGEYSLYIRAANGVGAARRIELHGAGFYEDPKWSPDGHYLSYRDNSQSLYVLDLQSGRTNRIAQEPAYTPAVTMTHNWAPDSQWLAYTINEHGLVQTTYLYSLREQRSFQITGALVDAGEPVFDPDGQHLYVAASIDAGPVRDWFTQSRAGTKITRNLYAISLGNDAGRDHNVAAFPLDPESTTDRTTPLPGASGAIRSVQVGRAGEIYYLAAASGDTATLFRYSVQSRKPQPMLEDVSEYRICGNGTRVLYKKADRWSIAELGARIDETAALHLPIETISVQVEPRAEWQQILRESWRIKRDFFYAANHHGIDWNAVWDKYQPFLAHAATRADVARIQYWMSTELAVGHSYVFPGESIEQPPSVSVGLLGADFESVAGRYRFSRIYDAHWIPGLRAPLKEAGGVTAGEYLLKVGETDVLARSEVYKYFQNTVGQPLTLTVGPHPDGRQARTLTVVPIDDEMMLRRVDWIENNIRKVDAATQGRVAYVYVPDTAANGLAFFKHYFYPQSHKEAIIIDARWNGGGSFADYYIDILRRAGIGQFATRYGRDQRVPRGAILGPKVLVANKMARSGGDLLAYMFRKLQLGPIVGTTTTGALVGNIGVPQLMDGGLVTAPNFAFWTEQEGWAVENAGVPPDVEVEQWPAAVNAGHDPQLEKAIETALQLLPATAPTQPTRPPYPDRVTRQPPLNDSE